jgi:hypothetical protein
MTPNSGGGKRRESQVTQPNTAASKRRRTSAVHSKTTSSFSMYESVLRQYPDSLHYTLIKKLFDLIQASGSKDLVEECNKLMKSHLGEIEQLTLARRKLLIGQWKSKTRATGGRMENGEGKVEINEGFRGSIQFPEHHIQATIDGIISGSSPHEELRLRIEQEGREGFIQLKLPPPSLSSIRKIAGVEDEEEDDLEIEGMLFLEISSILTSSSSSSLEGELASNPIHLKFTLRREGFDDGTDGEEDGLLDDEDDGELVVENIVEEEEEVNQQSKTTNGARGRGGRGGTEAGGRGRGRGRGKEEANGNGNGVQHRKLVQEEEEESDVDDDDGIDIDEDGHADLVMAAQLLRNPELSRSLQLMKQNGHSS